MKLIITIFLACVLFNDTSAANDDDMKKDLCQKILSCQSLYFTIMKQKEIKNQIFLSNIALEYLTDANKSFKTLVSSHSIESNAEVDIKAVLEMYQEVFMNFQTIKPVTNDNNQKAMGIAVGMSMINHKLAGLLKSIWKEN